MLFLGIVTFALMLSQSAHSDSRDYVDYPCAKAVFVEMDTNKNNTISLSEFSKAGNSTTLFNKIKLNKKNGISLGKFLLQWKDLF
jgi:hypothetical protein